MFKKFFSRVQNKEADDDLSTLAPTRKNIFRDVLTPEITIHISQFLPICDLNNFARCNQELLLQFFNLSTEKVNALAKRKEELKKLDIESRIVSVKDQYKEDENEMIQHVIWKPLVLYYFPNYSKSLNVKNWMHVLRRRVIHLQNRHPHELPLSKVIKGESTVYGGLYRDNKDRQTFVENCEWEYECPLKNNAFSHISTGVKFCKVCKENVFEVMNESEFEHHVKEGHCVSFNELLIKNKPARRGKIAYRQ